MSPAAEIPPDLATLLGLIENVKSRLSELNVQIVKLDEEQTSNQTSLSLATADLIAKQSAAYDSDLRVAHFAVGKATARLKIRDRAVAAYIHQPTGDLSNLLLHLQDPAELVDARGFYRTLVDVQVKSVQNYDRLDKEAKSAAHDADVARDIALKQKKSVADQQERLVSLKATLEQVRVLSNKQQHEQASLLEQVGKDRAKFAAEVAAQAQESANIIALLANLGDPNQPAPAATGGYFTLPIPGARITQRFGPNFDPFTGIAGSHPGIDFGATTGTPIHAAGEGTVVYAGPEAGYGNYTCIDHGHHVATCYAHQSAVLVQVGDLVKSGQVIGLVGSTGYSTGPHLHFEVRISGAVTDPMPWLTDPNAPTTTTSPPRNR
ncbi:MAG: M23 family metallopeptidase [Acidimicrobiales bacterium]